MRSSRRDFLKGKAAADALESKLRNARDSDNNVTSSERPSNLTGDAPAPARTYVIEVGRRAMACQFEVFMNAGEDASSTQQAIEALDLVEQIEDQLSIYRNNSQISELNAAAAGRDVQVDASVFGLLEQAVQLYRDTNHAFDITAGPLIDLWAQVRRSGIWPEAETVRHVLARVGSDKIRLDATTQSVRYAGEGTTINLGGIGKGYALDRCASHLQLGGVANFMMHGGSSSVVARGQRAADNELPGWTVGIRHPLREDHRLLAVQLVDAAIGTSGAGTKQFYHRGRRYGHVLDPRSGYPSEGVISATVLAPSAAVADALSTAFYVLGPERAESYCRRHSDVRALLTTASRQAGELDIHQINCDGLIVSD